MLKRRRFFLNIKTRQRKRGQTGSQETLQSTVNSTRKKSRSALRQKRGLKNTRHASKSLRQTSVTGIQEGMQLTTLQRRYKMRGHLIELGYTQTWTCSLRQQRSRIILSMRTFQQQFMITK
ncbi:hypothetical protein FGO68_gene779 [Halteria grandinella]|uniref:Uncharacterized protein n=1 Tax=Halteria grandinella TaxID=5974 RepID=A0A8J8NFV1_HALGN|nr:hypothetical protein FGO68_gene779 [Halteria grandinella]